MSGCQVSWIYTSVVILDDMSLYFYLELDLSLFQMLTDRMPNVRSLTVGQFRVCCPSLFSKMSILQNPGEIMNVLARASVWPNLQELHFPTAGFGFMISDANMEALFKSDKRITFLSIYIYSPLTIRFVLLKLSMLSSIPSCMQTFAENQFGSIAHLELSSPVSMTDSIVSALANCTNLSFLDMKCRQLTDTALGHLKVCSFISC